MEIISVRELRKGELFKLHAGDTINKVDYIDPEGRYLVYSYGPRNNLFEVIDDLNQDCLISGWSLHGKHA